MQSSATPISPVKQLLDAADVLYENGQLTEAIAKCTAAIKQIDDSTPHEEAYRVLAYQSRAKAHYVRALKTDAWLAKQQYMQQADDDYKQVFKLDPSTKDHNKKERFILDKIFGEYVHFIREYMIHKQNLHISVKDIIPSKPDYDSAALLYRLEEEKLSPMERLATLDQALTLCPQHTGLLKSCIELTKQIQAASKEPDEFNVKLEKYYYQLLDQENTAQNYFLFGLAVAKNEARQDEALAILLCGIKNDLPEIGMPDKLRNEVAICLFKLQNQIIVRDTNKQAPHNNNVAKKIIQLSDGIAKFQLDHINSQDFYHLGVHLSNEQRYDQSLTCGEIYVWLIVTSMDKNRENRKFLQEVVNRLATAYIQAIPDCIANDKPTSAEVVFNDWLCVLKKFHNYQPHDKSDQLTLISQLQTVDTLDNAKQFATAYEQINSILVAHKRGIDIIALIRAGTQTFARHLCDKAAQSLEKPSFQAIIDILGRLCILRIDEETLYQFVRNQIDMLKVESRKSPFQRMLDEGYSCYCDDKKISALEVLTKAINSKDTIKPSPTPTQLMHAYVLRSLSNGSQADKKAAEEIAEKIDPAQAKAAFYAYRRLKADTKARSVKFTTFLQHAAYCVQAREATGKDNKNAADSINKALEIYPDNADAWLIQGNQFYSEFKYADAVKSFSRSIALQPKQAAGYFWRATSYHELNRADDAIADLFAGIKQCVINGNLVVKEMILDIRMTLCECQDTFIAKHRSHADIVAKTKAIKTQFPQCAMLLFDRAQLLQKLNDHTRAAQDLQLALFLIKTDSDTTKNVKSLIPSLLSRLASILLDGDKHDLQSVLNQLGKYDFGVAVDEEEYKKFDSKHKNLQRLSGGKAKKLAVPTNLAAAVELKSFVTSNKDAKDLLAAKDKVRDHLHRYAQGGEHARVFAADRKALFDMCIQINEAAQKLPKPKEQQTLSAPAESKRKEQVISSSSEPDDAVQPNSNAKRNKKKKDKQKEKKLEAARKEAEEIKAAAQKREKEIEAWIKSTKVAQQRDEIAQQVAADKQIKAKEDQQKADEAQRKADAAQLEDEKAQARADEAQARAYDAQQKAYDAQQKIDMRRAEEAQRRAEEAQQRADEAQGRADAAQLRDEKAQAHADEAQKKAEDKQNKINLRLLRLRYNVIKLLKGTRERRHDVELAKQFTYIAAWNATKAENVIRIAEEIKEQSKQYKPTELPDLVLPPHLVDAMKKLHANEISAFICGGQLRKAIRNHPQFNMPPIDGKMDSDLVVGIHLGKAKRFLSLQHTIPVETNLSDLTDNELLEYLSLKFALPGTHIFKTKQSFIVKYPVFAAREEKSEGPPKFIRYDEERTFEVRVSTKLSNFKLPYTTRLRNHASTCDFTQGALFYDGNLYDAAPWIGKSSGLDDLRHGRLIKLKEYIEDVRLVFRLIYKYGRSEGKEIEAKDTKLIQQLTYVDFKQVPSAVTDSWLKKIFFSGHAVICVRKMFELDIFKKLFLFPEMSNQRVILELSKLAIEADKGKLTDFDEIYARLISTIADISHADPIIVKSRNQLFMDKFESYNASPSYCLNKIRLYENKRIEMPSVMKREIDCTVKRINTDVSNKLINNFTPDKYYALDSIQLLEFAFPKLNELVRMNPGVGRLVLQQLKNLSTETIENKLEHLYAFWIVVIANAGPRTLDLDLVRSENLFFNAVFPESIGNFPGYFEKAKSDYTKLAKKIHGMDLFIPPEYRKQYLPKKTEIHTHTAVTIMLADASQEQKQARSGSPAQMTAVAPKSPPVTKSIDVTDGIKKSVSHADIQHLNKDEETSCPADTLVPLARLQQIC